MEFLVGERLEHLKRSHLALEADDLIPEEIMQHVYGKEPERQVRNRTKILRPAAVPQSLPVARGGKAHPLVS